MPDGRCSTARRVTVSSNSFFDTGAFDLEGRRAHAARMTDVSDHDQRRAFRGRVACKRLQLADGACAKPKHENLGHLDDAMQRIRFPLRYDVGLDAEIVRATK